MQLPAGRGRRGASGQVEPNWRQPLGIINPVSSDLYDRACGVNLIGAWVVEPHIAIGQVTEPMGS